MKLAKRLFALALVLCMVFCLSVAVFADGSEGAATTPKADQDATFTKTYKIENTGTQNPEETFTFTFEANKIEESNSNLQVKDMPAISDVTVKYDKGTATTGGKAETLTVPLSSINWPGVGIYYYKVKETASNNAGVVYDNTEAWLKVTVAYDEGTSTYYTAFVTLNLADEDNDGQTDTKIGGFTNTYKAGDLTITKNVTGNLGDKAAYFEVDVTLTGEANKTYESSYTVSGGSSEANNATSIAIGTKTTFKLKNGDTIKIENLPYDVTYTVEEHDYTSQTNGGYDVPEYSGNIVKGTDGKYSESIKAATQNVTITNNKGAVVDTGVSLDSLPYILALAVAFGGAVVMFTRKRHVED